jgi:hypothetical protein
MSIIFTKDGIELIKDKWSGLKADFADEISRITSRIQQAYGPIDNSYSLTTLNFNSINAVATVVDETTRTITINLPAYTMADDTDALYQRKLNLSHELIHTITPCANPMKATYLDEGLATVFSEEYTGCDSGAPQKYQEARDFVLRLLETDNGIIKKLRLRYPHKRQSDYTVEDILVVIPSSTEQLINDLLRPFNAP